MALFPTTRHSAVRDLASDDVVARARSLEIVANAYWRPVYKYIRCKWRVSSDRAEDLVQAFFQTALDRDMLAAYAPARGRFRVFLRTCLDRFLLDQHRRATTLARGSGREPEELAALDRELAQAGQVDPDAIFDAEWLRHLMRLALERHEQALIAKQKTLQLALFRAFHGNDEPPSYKQAAEQQGVSVYDVTNGLHAARAEFKRIALALLGELTLDEEDYAEEARAVFGIDINAREG